MKTSRTILTIDENDRDKLFLAVDKYETEYETFLRAEYPEDYEQDSFSVYLTESDPHHGRIAISLYVDEKWGDSDEEQILDDGGVAYTREPVISVRDLEQNPFVIGDNGFWVDGQSDIEWHNVGDVIPSLRRC